MTFLLQHINIEVGTDLNDVWGRKRDLGNGGKLYTTTYHPSIHNID